MSERDAEVHTAYNITENQPSTAASSQSPIACYAFLNHSQKTLPNNLPPDIDNKPLARQKRRRTSPEDQAILEEAYSTDPKPDKAARVEIVKQVALGEKEVQIWFQNRRQNDRRKSRPLLPHEVQSALLSRYGLGIDAVNVLKQLSAGSQDGGGAKASHKGTEVSFLRGTTDKPSETTAAGVTGLPMVSERSLPAGPCLTDSSKSPNTSRYLDVSAPNPPDATPRPESNASSQKPPKSEDVVANDVSSSTASQAVVAGVGYLANRRSAFLADPSKNVNSQDDNRVLTLSNDKVDEKIISAASAGRKMKRTTSNIRLGMTVNGNATVVMNDSPSPSPPRSRPEPCKALERNIGLRRSLSSTSLIAKRQYTEADGVTPLPGRAKGRSRDSRAWEFWCDGDARSALADRADQEQTGSAATEIESIRSSSRGTLVAHANMGNSQLQRQSSAKRIKPGAGAYKRPQLRKAHTSLARLQDAQVELESKIMLSAPSKNAKPSWTPSTEFMLFDDDSDKENWEPGTQIPARRRARPQQGDRSRILRRVLTDSGRPMDTSTIPAAMATRGHLKDPRKNYRRLPVDADKENGLSWEEDAEVAGFMAQSCPQSADSRSSVSGEEEMHCVQGLLSLSQGCSSLDQFLMGPRKNKSPSAVSNTEKRSSKSHETQVPKSATLPSFPHKVRTEENNIQSVPLEVQQRLLNIFRNAFPDIFNEQLSPLLQEVKMYLYNRDFTTAFGREDYLTVYAARWSPSRALAYLEIFNGILPYLLSTLDNRDDTSTDAETISRPDVVHQLSNYEVAPSRAASVTCLGGGAGSELVAFTGLQHLMNSGHRSEAKSSLSNVTFKLVSLDVASWSPVLDALYKSATTPPPLSAYASASARSSSVALVPSTAFGFSFEQHDLLSPDTPESSVALNALTSASLVTALFTLNELYHTSVPKTQTFLHHITTAVRRGTLLLVVDSPGSYATVTLNGKDKRYPMAWLLDYTLTGPVATKAEADRRWEKLISDESRWFRLPGGLQYPIELENMRYQIHLYRRL